jgi:hypothetical protein
MRREAFLHEAVVVGEDVGEAFLAHGVHGDAVGEGVVLVGALTEEIESADEGAGWGLRGRTSVSIRQCR